MNRRKFTLAWGRKVFFGLSWPFSSLLTILYLRSFILPETQVDWLYFVVTFVGHIGFLNAALYFLLFCPVILLLPSYYVSRLWALLLILALNLFIFVDALSFSSYHLHIYSYISKLLAEQGVHHLIGSSAGVMLLTTGALVLAVFVWIRGDILWRYMSGRFSNPIRNWYLLVILLCLGTSKILHRTSDIHPKLADMFPLNFHLPRPAREFHDNRRFYYPADNLVCQGKQNPNVVLIVVKEWSNDEYTEELMPRTYHMKRHAMSFNRHLGVATDVDGGLFSLLYSVPASYESSIDQSARPALFRELSDRKYEVATLASGRPTVGDPTEDAETMERFRWWLTNRSGGESRPYFLSLVLGQRSLDADKLVHQIVLDLQQEELLRNTHFLITGAFAGAGDPHIPLLWVTPERRPGEFNHVTSQYDVLPSFMQRIWSCKKAFKAASVGEPLEKPERDWILVSGKDEFRIVDLRRDNVISVSSGKVSSPARDARVELIFSGLELMTKFNRPN
jgi:membrane-anchored protein YejM (alkaline phosphatase superfamily)